MLEEKKSSYSKRETTEKRKKKKKSKKRKIDRFFLKTPTQINLRDLPRPAAYEPCASLKQSVHSKYCSLKAVFSFFFFFERDAHFSFLQTFAKKSLPKLFRSLNDDILSFVLFSFFPLSQKLPLESISLCLYRIQLQT
jgi:hypothetical protein